MKNKLYLFIIYLFLSTDLLAQKQGQEKLDSLIQQLRKSVEDTNKVTLLNDICFSYRTINPNEGIKYGEQGLALAEKLAWKQGMAVGNNRIGVNYMTKSEYPKALEYLLASLKLNEELGNKKSIASNLGNIGVLHEHQSNYTKALGYYVKSSDIFKELISTSPTKENKNGLARTLGNIGGVYAELADYNKALEYHFQALKINEEIDDKSGIATNQGNIGMEYLARNDYEKAHEFCVKALQSKQALGLNQGIATMYDNIAQVYVSIVNKSQDPMAAIEINKLFNGNKQAALRKAKIFTDSAIFIYKDIENLEDLSQAYKHQSEIQMLLGDPVGALESFKLHSILKDSVFNLEKDKKLTESAMQYEFDKKETIAKATQEKKDIQQRNIRNTIMVGLATALIFLIVVFRQRNKVRKEKEKVEYEKERNEELLLNILPEEVANELKKTGGSIAKQYNNVSVLFTDFINFTGISQQLSPTELVSEIHKNFMAFDAIIEKNGLEKIKTIGDAYLAVCGLPNETSNHAQRVIQAAIEIREYVASSNGKFQIRIGVNSGPVVAGIVGVKKYAYDIWGDTVNTASRMEASSESGKINISGSTYELVKGDFTFEYRGKISAKGKGEVDMYFVL